MLEYTSREADEKAEQQRMIYAAHVTRWEISQHTEQV